MTQQPSVNDSVDDQLEGEQEGGEHLVPQQPQDNDTPFSPPDSPIDDPSQDLDDRTHDARLDPTHPATDTNLDSQEVYDEGLSGGAEAEEPNT